MSINSEKKVVRVACVRIIAGAVTAIAGVVTSIVHLFQPWRTNPYDDTPAACAMLPADAAILAVALIASFLGLCVLVSGIVARVNAPRS